MYGSASTGRSNSPTISTLAATSSAPIAKPVKAKMKHTSRKLPIVLTSQLRSRANIAQLHLFVSVIATMPAPAHSSEPEMMPFPHCARFSTSTPLPMEPTK